MSWFSDLTSKAEAMLVRLDQDAAQALQNSDTILRGTKLLDKAIGVLDSSRQESEPFLEESAVEEGHLLESSSNTDQEQPSDGFPKIQQTSADPQIRDQNEAQQISVTENLKMQQPSGKTYGNTLQPAHPYEKLPGQTPPDANHNSSHVREQESANISPQSTQPQARKFKLQTSKLRQPLLDRQAAAASESSSSRANGHGNRSSKRTDDTQPTSPGADDIRASINRSLHEYSLSASSAQSRLERDPNERLTTYESHFDSQPNLIQSIDSDYDHNNRLNDRLQSSPSFSISFPPDSSKQADDEGTDIADRILRQSALKKKSTFNLHKVLNKLAGNKGGHPQAIIGDKTKLRLRRVQMRVASQLRRLNYYFRAYPTMKYWMLGYLVALQLLVIYVLFFYQSSGSSSYLAAQVKQQQQELDESLVAQSNSEKSIPSSGDLRPGGFR